MNRIFKKLYLNLVFTLRLYVFALVILSFSNFVQAQSINQNFPTPITTSEISGKIPARDIGDARLTNYFYSFNGIQGDVFINVQTSNLNGDIDIFTADSLKALTKITIYADISQNETGRVIYLRKPEKLILRIQGRSPNDDAGTFNVKFAGSFQPLLVTAETSAPETPEVKTDNKTDVRVNSVGTIIEIKPKPTPLPKETIAKTEKPRKKKTKPAAENKELTKADSVKKDEKIKEVKETENKKADTDAEKEVSVENQKEITPKVVETDETANKDSAEKEVAKIENKEVTSEKTENKTSVEIAKTKIPKTITRESARTRAKRTENQTPPASNPLENIRLVVLFKDGTKIEHQMSDVLRFNIIKGILTVTTKGGKIKRYSILDIEKTTIE